MGEELSLSTNRSHRFKLEDGLDLREGYVIEGGGETKLLPNPRPNKNQNLNLHMEAGSTISSEKPIGLVQAHGGRTLSIDNETGADSEGPTVVGQRGDCAG